MIVLDYHDKRPIYEQIIDRFQLLILNGALEPDSQLPSVRSLAIDLSINANTIQRAYSELERKGLIYSVKGRGNFVSAQKDVVKEQQELLLDTLREQLFICKESGIQNEQIFQCVREIFSEVKK
jgi:GntR family transcriptional regulator